MEDGPGKDGIKQLNTRIGPAVFDKSRDVCGGDITHNPQITSSFIFLVCHPVALEVFARELYSMYSSAPVV